MKKTTDQRLQSAANIIGEDNKKIEEQKRQINALQHQVTLLQQQRTQLNAQAQIRDAQLKSAEMYISYLAKLACDRIEVIHPKNKKKFRYFLKPEKKDHEIVIPFEELAKFKTGYSVASRYDEGTKNITIQINEITKQHNGN